eukprot:6491044-Amphidinium_carterae.3
MTMRKPGMTINYLGEGDAHMAGCVHKVDRTLRELTCQSSKKIRGRAPCQQLKRTEAVHHKVHNALECMLLQKPKSSSNAGQFRPGGADGLYRAADNNVLGMHA